jgi:hypothetical protein
LVIADILPRRRASYQWGIGENLDNVKFKKIAVTGIVQAPMPCYAGFAERLFIGGVQRA